MPTDHCFSCGEGMPAHECPESERACGHHCNCSWTQDVCHWCGATFGEEEEKAADEALAGLGVKS